MSMINLKKTPLNDLHEQLGARLIDFAGWNLPVQYTSIITEHLQTRNQASLFDVSHMGELDISGPQAYSFLQHLLTNDLGRLKPGECQYTILCNEKGGTIDDCLVYQFAPDHYWVVTNASNTDKDREWIKAHSQGYKVQIKDISLATAKIDIQGPLAASILNPLVEYSLAELKRFTFVETGFKGQHGRVAVVVSRTGYTGEDGFEIFMPWEQAPEVWQTLLASSTDLKPAGLGARDTLRIEACYPLYGHELDEQTTPVEAGLGWVVRTKAEDYPGKEHLFAQKQLGTGKQLYAFIMAERLVPRPDYPLYYKGEKAGRVTSGCFSPVLNKSLGLGYIDHPGLKTSEKITVSIRDNFYEATIADKPFYQYKGVLPNGQGKSG